MTVPSIEKLTALQPWTIVGVRAGDLLDALATTCDVAADARNAVQRVREMHFARGRNILGQPVCNECSPLQPMPCPTLRALDGQQ